MTAAFTPGSYVAARRRAQRLSIDDVAERLDSEPTIPAVGRREWIAMIEADTAPISADIVISLRRIFHFDVDVLDRLIDLRIYGADLPEPRLCRVCGCSQEDACITRSASGPIGCSWIEDDLCSACPPVRVPLSSSVRVPPVTVSTSEGA